MKLIERYVHDVARRLPEKQRADVAKELTAEIEEMVDDRTTNKRAGDAVLREVLLELGSPSKLADQYRDRPRFVIGPEYYEPYVFLLKTVYAVVLPLLAFILFMNESMTATHSILSLSGKIAGVMFEAAVHIFFWVTLSFMFVQKVAAGERYDENWKPEDLPSLPASQEITHSEAFMGIAWSLFAVIATLYQIPFVYQLFGPDTVPQFFAPSMWPGWTLGLLALSLLGLGIECTKLYVGGWTKFMVGLVTVANIITVSFFLLALQYAQPIANPALLELIAESLGRDDITEMVSRGITIFVGVVAMVSIAEVYEAFYKYRKGTKR